MPILKKIISRNTVEKKFDTRESEIWDENVEESISIFGIKIFHSYFQYKSTDHEPPKHATKGKVGY